MANWYGSARTNYFKIKEGKEKEFRQLMRHFPVSMWDGQDKREGLVAVGVTGSDDGGFPSYVKFPLDAHYWWESNKTVVFDKEETNDGIFLTLDFPFLLALYLDDDYVLIGMQSGAEKLRYVDGYAIAVDSKLRSSLIRLDDIYTKADRKFKGKTITEASY